MLLAHTTSDVNKNVGEAAILADDVMARGDRPPMGRAACLVERRSHVDRDFRCRNASENDFASNVSSGDELERTGQSHNCQKCSLHRLEGYLFESNSSTLKS